MASFEIIKIQYMKNLSQIIHRYTSISLVLRVVIGLAIGVVLGLLVPSWTGIGILGKMFVGALKSIAPVLVAVLVTSSIAKADKGHGPRFAVLIALYLLSTFVAALLENNQTEEGIRIPAALQPFFGDDMIR